MTEFFGEGRVLGAATSCGGSGTAEFGHVLGEERGGKAGYSFLFSIFFFF